MQVGRYEILEIIGTGAHGRVARAHDAMIGRLVAIKLFPKELASGEARHRFIQEARVVGQLSHPSIITLHDMGIDEATHTPYLVMEFMDGQPLDRILDKGSIPFPKACAWAAEVASALGVAHRKGVIHGDVKPANVLIADDGRVKLMDFGMARLASRDSGATPLLGTPAYWCPEQIMGKPQDARSDLFSLRRRCRPRTPILPCRRYSTISLPAALRKIRQLVTKRRTQLQRNSIPWRAASRRLRFLCRKPMETASATALRVSCALPDDYTTKRPLPGSGIDRVRNHEPGR